MKILITLLRISNGLTTLALVALSSHAIGYLHGGTTEAHRHAQWELVLSTHRYSILSAEERSKLAIVLYSDVNTYQNWSQFPLLRIMNFLSYVDNNGYPSREMIETALKNASPVHRRIEEELEHRSNEHKEGANESLDAQATP